MKNKEHSVAGRAVVAASAGLGAALLWSMLGAGLAVAETIVVDTSPDALNPGQSYRLVFITDDGTTSESGDISTYHASVNDYANGIPTLAALSVSWFAIGSGG